MYSVIMNVIKKIITLLFIFTSSLVAKNVIHLQLDWLHQFQFAGYYMAIEKGYYKEKNLTVNIREYTYNTDQIKDVLENKNTYAVGKSSLIIDKLNGDNIFLLSAIYQTSPMVLISLKNKNIKSIKDLRNKNIMITNDAKTAASINYMLKSQNIDLKDVNLQKHTFKIDDLINNNTDSMASYLSNEPYILEQKNIPYTIFNPKNYGFNFYGGILFTSQYEIKQNPQKVKNFLDASLKGWDYAFSNIEETAKLIYEKYNTQNKSIESLIYEGKILKELAEYEKGNLGKLNKERINEIKRLYLLVGLGKNNINLNYNNFIFNKNSILYNTNEESYLNSKNIYLYNNYSENSIELDYWKYVSNKLEIPTLTTKKKNLNNSIIFSFTKDKFDIDLSKYSLSNTISNIPIALISKIDKKYVKDLKEIKNKTIGLLKDNVDLLKKLEKEYKNINFITLKNKKQALELLRDDVIFAYIDDINIIQSMLLKNKTLKITGVLKETLELRIYTDKEYEIFINIINKLIKTIPELDNEKILSKYKLIIYKNNKDNSWIYFYILPLCIILIIVIYFNLKMRKEIKDRINTEKQLKEFATKDALTMIYNRRAIEKIIDSLIELKHTFSIILFDIDNFKKINDTYGHLAGDKVLVLISKLVSRNIRENDFFARWGGEEFIIALPNTTKNQAFNIAFKLKNSILEHNFDLDIKITASFGISEFQKDISKKQLIKKADEALYVIKNTGKNNIEIR